jgi:hypothetical protein
MGVSLVSTGVRRGVIHGKEFGKTDKRIEKILILICTSRSIVFLEKLTGSQLVKKFPSFYGTQRFITAFTSARHLSLF